ncbi:hypothetical protein C817_00134 [Dorea sp. 5-2]|jgi:hypothetical protein|nr:hypothetical protein C817_00134 [Dorea sp. 5-2]MCI9024826.1 hypothetical protein [Dorea sp.]
MLDQRKIELMTRLAFYEQTDGKNDFKVSEFYRKDYTSLHTICSVLWVTVGYLCVIGIVVLMVLEDILENLSNSLIVMLGGMVLLGYISLVIVYAIITNHIYDEKHRDARQRVKKYNHNLTRLLRMYEKENR